MLATGAFAAPEAGRPDSFCGHDRQRACGPLADDGAVEPRGVAQNLEGGSSSPIGGFQVSIDGQPVAPEAVPADGADGQRRADVALAGAGVKVQVSALDVQPVLSLVAARPVIGRGERAEFQLFANYAAFIDHAELRVFDEGRRLTDPPLTVIPVTLGRPVVWSPDAGGDRTLRVVLRVYDRTGRFDETEAQLVSIRLVVAQAPPAARQGPLFENQRRLANIPVRGAQVTVSGTAVSGSTVTALGETARADADGRYLVQQILPAGEGEVVVRLERPGGPPEEIRRKVGPPAQDRFFVGIADLTVGHRGVSAAHRDLLGDNTDYRSDFADGRLAFYFRGRVSPKWRITAAADTQEQPLSHLFDSFGDKDPRALLRRFNPDLHYPVYGDDSLTVEDAPTSGRFYFRAESENALVMWGDFHSELGDAEFMRYQRGLYGGQALWRSPASTGQGERRTEVSGFAADPGTVGSREEFASTGGSVYYLRHTDISRGSERLFMEVRDRDSGLVLDRTELLSARDFDVNALQGRLLLRSPLPITAEGGDFVRSGSLAGNPVWLVATYEYSPGLTRPDALTAGGRVQHWFGDHLRLGASAYRQGEDQDRQDLKGGDILLRYTSSTFLRAEVANSRGASGETQVSSFAGYDFTGLRTGSDSAYAYLLQGEADLADLGGALAGHAQGYWRRREAGFSAPGELTFGEALDLFGGKLEVKIAPGVTVSAKADITDGDLTRKSAIEAGIRRETDRGWFGSVGARYEDQAGQLTPYSPLLAAGDRAGSRTDAAVQLGYRRAGRPARAGLPAERPWGAFVFGQKTLEHDGGRLRNDRVGVGGDAQINDRLTVKGEVSDGDLGLGANIRSDLAVDDRGSLYLSYALAAENPDGLYPGRLGRLGAGAKYRLTDQVTAFAEERYDHGSGPTGLSQSYGVDFSPLPAWTYGVRFETGKLADALGQGVKRSVVGGSVDYGGERLRWASNLEYRDEQGAGLGARHTWATRNTASWKVDDALRLFAKANLSLSSVSGAAATDTLDADYYEVALAGAYRPADNDRLNLLAKYTYLHDLPSPDQVGAYGLSLDFAQRSHIAAIDASYQFTPRLELGAKAAYRLGELRPSRDASAPWFSSRALFLAVRADYRVVREWDVLVEARSLSVSEADDRRLGALVAVYRHFGDHVKVGVGYNFTSFSDDLSDHSYDDGGVFLNIIGKY